MDSRASVHRVWLRNSRTKDSRGSLEHAVNEKMTYEKIAVDSRLPMPKFLSTFVSFRVVKSFTKILSESTILGSTRLCPIRSKPEKDSCHQQWLNPL